MSRYPSYFSKPCLEVTSPRHTTVLWVPLSISVKGGVKGHPNTNVKDISQGTSPELSGKGGLWSSLTGRLWGLVLSLITGQKQKNPIILLNKASCISRPCFPSNSTFSFSGTCVKLCSGCCRVSCLNVFLMKQCHSKHKSRCPSTSDRSSVGVLNFYLWEKSGLVYTSFQVVLGKEIWRNSYAVGNKRPVFIVGCHVVCLQN